VIEKFENIANIIKTKLAFFNIQKLNRIIRELKDFLPIGFNRNVIYKLSCKNCDVAFVGQTKRKLNTRNAEHRKDINEKTSNLVP